MAITRRSLFDEISLLDEQIAELQSTKAGCFAAYREQMISAGEKKIAVADEIAACKKAFRRLRALNENADAVAERDALIDEIIAEIRDKKVGTNNAIARACAPRASGAVVSRETSTKQIMESAAVGVGDSEPAPVASTPSLGTDADFDVWSIPEFLRRAPASEVAP